MALNIVIDRAADLAAITGVIHDCWFEKKDICFRRDSSVVEIRFSREIPQDRKVLKNFLLFKKVKIPAAECVLKVHHAIDCRVEDKEKVGRHDFNEIAYDPDKQEMTVLTGVPIDIKIRVQGFKLAVEETGQKMDDRTTLTFL